MYVYIKPFLGEEVVRTGPASLCMSGCMGPGRLAGGKSSPCLGDEVVVPVPPVVPQAGHTTLAGRRKRPDHTTGKGYTKPTAQARMTQYQE